MSDELGKSLQYSVNQKFGRGAYQVLEPIKRGADGYVYKIEFIREKKLGALKVLPKTSLTMETDHKENLTKKHKHEQDLIKKAENEIRIHSLFKSGYIIKLINSFSDEMNFYIMMEYVPRGDLGDEIAKSNHGLPLARIRKIGLQLAKGIDTIHKKSVIHRDIKPRNILLTGEDEIKICDFSCAKQISEDDGDKTQGVIGSLGFIAPEIINKYGNSVDIWSFGCVLYTMLTGKIPFKQEKKLEQKIEKEKVFDYLRKVTNESVKELIENLYENHHKEKSKQISENESSCECKDNSHKECYNKLEHLLQNIFILKPSERIIMTQIINHPFFTGEHMKISNKIIEGKDLIYDLTKPKKMEPERSQTRPKSHQSLEIDSENVKEGNKTTRTMILSEKERYPTSESTNKFGKFKVDQINQKENININNLVKPKVHKELEELINSKLNQPTYNIKISTASCIQQTRSQSPLNCEGIYYSIMCNPNEKVVIDEKGLRAEFNKGEKVMQITPKGGHVILGVEGKSREYELNKLPDKYITFYAKYKEVVKQVKNKMAKRGESANGRASRTSKSKHNQSHTSNFLENHEKSRPLSQNSSQCREITPRSQVEIPIYLPSSYLNIVFQLEKNSQRTSLSLVSPVLSQSISISHVGELKSVVGFTLSSLDRKVTISDINQITEELDKYYHWIQTMPILQPNKKNRQESQIEGSQKYSSKDLLNYHR